MDRSTRRAAGHWGRIRTDVSFRAPADHSPKTNLGAGAPAVRELRELPHPGSLPNGDAPAEVGRRWGTLRAHGRRILSLRRGHDLGGRRSARAHVLQLLDLPPDRRAVVVLLADPGPGRRADADLSVGRQVARSPSLPDLRLHHALVAGRSGARSHGRQRAPDGARDRRGGAGPTVRRRRYVDVPRLALSPQSSTAAFVVVVSPCTTSPTFLPQPTVITITIRIHQP